MSQVVTRKRLEQLWKSTKADVSKVAKDAALLIREGEEYIKDQSGKGKQKLENLSLVLKRERLYYDLGKTIANPSKNKASYNKKKQNLLNQIQDLNLKIKGKK